MKSLKNVLLLATLCISTTQILANQDIAGKWRSIDDKTGFSKGIIQITKDSDGVYSGKIVEIIPRPGYTPKSLCEKCQGELKNKPILGLQVMDGMKQSSDNTTEYEGGTVLDPLTGNVYKSKMKLNSTGTRITMRGYIGVEKLGRNQTWIRQN